jgi:hypothetical protein
MTTRRVASEPLPRCSSIAAGSQAKQLGLGILALEWAIFLAPAMGELASARPKASDAEIACPHPRQAH